MIRYSFEEGMVVRRAGPSGAPWTLVWIHGLGESALGFESLLRHPALARFHQVAPDLPGYGKSPWTDRPEGLQDHAGRLRRFLSSLAGPQVLVGHSMGGVIGVYLCESRPTRLAGFVNVEGNVSEDDCAYSGRIAARPLRLLLEGGFDRFVDGIYLAGRNDRALRGYYASMRLCDPATLHRNSEELVAASRRRELAQRQAALGIPNVYVLGDPRGTGATSRGLLAGAGVVWHAVPDAGHWPFLEQPDRFIDVLTAFVDSLPALP